MNKVEVYSTNFRSCIEIVCYSLEYEKNFHIRTILSIFHIKTLFYFDKAKTLQ